MTIHDINLHIQAIHEEIGDYETQHRLEDRLYLAFVEYVASLKDKAFDKELFDKAQAVLKTRDIRFPRHCA